MAKCQLDIKLDTLEPEFLCGDSVTGEVRVDVDEECQCDALSLNLGWATHGKGNTSEGESQAGILFQGVWQPGQYSYPFRMELDQRPLSYDGKYINIDWLLQARADVPWAMDPKASLKLQVKDNPGMLMPERDVKPEYEYADSLRVENNGLIMTVIMIAVMLAMIVFGALATKFMESFLVGSFPGLVLPPWLGWLVGAGLGLWSIRRQLSNWLASRKLGKVSIVLDNSHYRAGDTVEARVVFTPKKSTGINRVGLRLILVEQAISGSGTNRRTHTHESEFQMVDVLPAMTLTANLPVNKAVRLQLPKDAVPSFNAGDNKLGWLLKLDADIPSWPDLTVRERIDIR